MPPIINAQQISKAFGANPLFQNVSFTVSEGDRIGLIGPNGSGKSTLLRILAGDVDADSGEVSTRKRARLSYVEQESKFNPNARSWAGAIGLMQIMPKTGQQLHAFLTLGQVRALAFSPDGKQVAISSP